MSGSEHHLRLRPLLRIGGVALVAAFALSVPVLIWLAEDPDRFDARSLEEMLRLSAWGWGIGILLIVADVVLPVPSTAVMAALGVIYGPVTGGALSAVASILSGSVAYGMARALGRRNAVRLAGPNGITEARHLLTRWGLPLIAASRWLPVLPETVPFVAGLTAMPFGRFLAALAAGSVPLGFVFATAGHLGRQAPVVVVIGCALAPAAVLGLIRLVHRLRSAD